MVECRTTVLRRRYDETMKVAAATTKSSLALLRSTLLKASIASGMRPLLLVLLLCVLPGTARTDAPRRDAAQLNPNEINWCVSAASRALLRCIALTTVCREARRPKGVQRLSVGVPLMQQALRLDEDTARCVRTSAAPERGAAEFLLAERYALHGLQADAAYEVRVSYPGTVPADVRVRFAKQRRKTSDRRASAARAGASRCAQADVPCGTVVSCSTWRSSSSEQTQRVRWWPALCTQPPGKRQLYW